MVDVIIVVRMKNNGECDEEVEKGIQNMIDLPASIPNIECVCCLLCASGAGCLCIAMVER